MNRRDFLEKGGIGLLWLAGLGSLKYIYSDLNEKQFNNQILAINREGYEQKYHTIAHEVLDLESELGAGPADKYLLDNILSEILEKTADQEVTNKKTALNFLKTIDDAIGEEGYGKYSKIDGCSLHRGLTKERRFDCYGMSLIYTSVGEIIRNIDISPVVLPRTKELPGHICLKLNDFYWDPIEARERTNEYYKNQRNISESAINNGVYLHGLNRMGILSRAYEKIASDYYDRGNFERSLELFEKAVELDPKNVSANFNIGFLYSKYGKFDEAKGWYNRVKDLDPNFYIPQL